MLVVVFFCIGMVSTSAQPIFAYLVDIRHASVYGNVYAISDMSVCLAMTIGRFTSYDILYRIMSQYM